MVGWLVVLTCQPFLDYAEVIFFIKQLYDFKLQLPFYYNHLLTVVASNNDS